MSKLHELAEVGQSIWLDYMRRDMLDSGELSQLRETGVRGVTSNPSIFEKAIAHSDDYDEALRVLAAEGKSPLEIYEALAIEDIQRACDTFAGLYRQTDGDDGFVSLEANPNLAYETEKTIEEVRRLSAAVDRPNAYIKVPATPQGIPAIEQLTAEGISVNVTLIFALSAYEQVAEAYIAGLETLAENGGDLRDVSSVASFFVSRVDTKVDDALDELGNEELRGKIGIANAKVAYRRFQELFSGPRWEKLARQGARPQRPLWGSTSTKDPAYPDTMYVDSLIGPHTVNTVPPETLQAFLDHGTVACTVDKEVDKAQAQLEQLAELGINLDDVTDQLLEEGVEKFATSFNNLLGAIETRRSKIRAEGRRRAGWDVSLGSHEHDVSSTQQALETNDVLRRLWEKDYTLWSDEPEEITNRLDWLHVAQDMQDEASRLRDLARNLRDEGYTDALLLGMGGSSLAPELFARTFERAEGHLRLQVLDSTDPGAVSACRLQLDPEKTVIIVSSKSGSTVETLSLFKYFYNWMQGRLGAEGLGDHFMAITDEGSKLATLAEELNFRALFLNNPRIGGRYSALSHFGLVPAALLGIDLKRLLQGPAAVAGPQDASEAAQLGAAMGTLAQLGRDKLTLITSPEIASFGDWAEQLIAESTGKEGTGIVPVVGEPPAAPAQYGDDRFFVYVPLEGGTTFDEEIEAIAGAGHPVMTRRLHDRYALGEQFLTWEIATAVAGHVLGVNPFNQPNVEAAKQRARELIDDYERTGSLKDNLPQFKAGGIGINTIGGTVDTAAEALENFLEHAEPDGYIAIQAYVQPTDETDAALHSLRRYLREKTGAAVTVGYGPRFLHSTGQLHKGDAGNGIFLQLLTEPLQDLPIPDEPGSTQSAITFGTLKVAQCLGDAEALREAGRRVIRFKYGGDVPTLIASMIGG